MDQDTAQHLFEAGAMLLFLDVPPGTEIGIDMHSWQTGEKFKGIKMIPPGLHFIYFRYNLCSHPCNGCLSKQIAYTLILT